MNVALLTVPLISIITATMHFYNSREFIELVLSQPIPRKAVFLGEYLGISFGLVIATICGLGIPMLLYGISWEGLLLIAICSLITMIFTGIAFLCAISANDKAKGIGLAMIIWFFMVVIFDALLLLVLFLFSDYPLEKFMIVITWFNPIDLSRIIILLQTDTAALMGYTGAIYNQYLGTFVGLLTCSCALLIWMLLPALLAAKKFNKKDF